MKLEDFELEEITDAICCAVNSIKWLGIYNGKCGFHT